MPSHVLSMRIHRFVLEESVRPQFVSVERVLLGKTFCCRWCFIAQPETPLGTSHPTSFRVLPTQMVLDWQSLRADVELSEKTLATFSERVILFQIVEISQVAPSASSSPLALAASSRRDAQQVIASGTIDPAVFAKRSQKDYAIKLEQNFVCVGKLFLNILVESIDAKEFAECTELARSLAIVVERLSVAPRAGAGAAGSPLPISAAATVAATAADQAQGFTVGGDYVLRVKDGDVVHRTPSTICEDVKRLRWNYELRFSLGVVDAASASLPLVAPDQAVTGAGDPPRPVKFTLLCDGTITVAKFILDLTRVRELVAGSAIGEWRGCSIPVSLRSGGHAVLDILVRQTETLRLAQHAAPASPTTDSDPSASTKTPLLPSSSGEEKKAVSTAQKHLQESTYVFPVEGNHASTNEFRDKEKVTFTKPPPVRTEESPLSIATPSEIKPAVAPSVATTVTTTTTTVSYTNKSLGVSTPAPAAAGSEPHALMAASTNVALAPPSPVHSPKQIDSVREAAVIGSISRSSTIGRDARSPQPMEPAGSAERSGSSHEADLIKILTQQVMEQQKLLHELSDEVRQLRCSSVASVQSAQAAAFRSDSVQSGYQVNSGNAVGLWSSRSPSTESATVRGRAQTPQKTHTLEQFNIPPPMAFDSNFATNRSSGNSYPLQKSDSDNLPDRRSMLSRRQPSPNTTQQQATATAAPSATSPLPGAKPKPKLSGALAGGSSSSRRSTSRTRALSSSAWR